MSSKNRLLKIDEKPRLAKERNSGAVLNTSRDEVERYKAKKAAIHAQRLAEENLITTQERLDKLENQMEQIKQLLIKAIS